MDANWGSTSMAARTAKAPPERGFREMRQTGFEPVTFGFVVPYPF